MSSNAQVQAQARRAKGLYKQVGDFNSRNPDRVVKLDLGYGGGDSVRVSLCTKPSVTLRASMDDANPRMVHVYARVTDEDASVHYISLSFEGVKAPVVRYLTENSIFHAHMSVCIDGLTHFHGESWKPDAKIDQMINILMMPITDPDAVADTFAGAIGSKENTGGQDVQSYATVPRHVIELFDS